MSGALQSPPLPGRVVIFVQGTRVPAARARGFALAHALSQRGVRCEVRAPVPSVYGDTALPWPLSRLRWCFRPVAAVVRAFQLRDLRGDDVVFFQRPMVEFPTAIFERVAARGRASIFDFDDAIFLDLGGRAKLAAIVSTVDHVIAGNSYLAQAADAPTKTTIIPTVVDTERFRALPTRDRRNREVVVGWTGLRGNYRQLMEAYEGLARALRRTGARLLLISNGPPPDDLRSLGAEYRPWREASEIEDLSEIDIGIMPLPDSPFARGKCAFKLIQYMALARPAVASPVGANGEVVTSGENGFLAQGAAAWEDALVSLIEDPDLRQRMGGKARRRIEDVYSMNAVLPLYLSAIERARGRAPHEVSP